MLKRLSDLRVEQIAAINFIVSGEDALGLAGVGTGKTVVALTAAERLLESVAVTRWLVLAPPRVCADVWPTEPAEWEHLSVTPVYASGTPKRRKKIIDDTANKIVTLTYENLVWLLQTYPRRLPFDGIIYDEVDKLQNISSARYKALKSRLKSFRFRIGMTGTPTGNHLQELYGVTYVVDGGQTWGRSFGRWQKENFHPVDRNQYVWVPFDDTQDRLLRDLDGLAFRMKGQGLPEVVENTPRFVTLSASVRHIYGELEREFFARVLDENGNLRDVDAVNAGVLRSKLEQITAGFSYVDPDHCHLCGEPDPTLDEEVGVFYCRACLKRVPGEAVWHSKDKFKELEALRSELFGQQLLVVYHFRAERDELERRYPGIPSLSGVSDKQARKTIDAWNAGELEMLPIHPASAGHGLNLQKSAAHHIATLTRPWSGRMDVQVKGRLARTGQKSKRVFIHPILTRDTIDEFKLARVLKRVEAMQRFLDRIRAPTSPAGKGH